MRRAAASSAGDWRPDDSVRAEVNLERVLKIGFAAWLLSSNEGPSIGYWKFPRHAPSPRFSSAT